MGLLGILLGSASRRRGYGSGFGSRRGYSASYGRGRSSSFISSPLGRMALGSLAAYGARRFMASRQNRGPMGPSAY
jgi:hypothetical protein